MDDVPKVFRRFLSCHKMAAAVPNIIIAHKGILKKEIELPVSGKQELFQILCSKFLLTYHWLALYHMADSRKRTTKEKVGNGS